VLQALMPVSARITPSIWPAIRLFERYLEVPCSRRSA
jgi:hypothetical protein